MKKIDLCPDRGWYFSQLNNEQDPKIACQATTATQIIALIDDIEILRKAGSFKQPEDNLRAFCKSPEMMAFCIKSHGKDWNNYVYHPSEWADVLVLAINTLMGYKCARYVDPITIDNIQQDLDNGIPVQVCMRFPALKIAGHYISVVGYFENGDLLINDPYRNWLHDKQDGYHVRYTLEDWDKHSKRYGLRFSKRI